MYFESNKDKENFFNIEQYHFFNDLKDKKLIQKFKELSILTTKKRTPQQVLKKLVGEYGWSAEDEEILSQTSVDEYYNIFKSENGAHLPLWISKCLEFERSSNPREKLQKITNNTKEALKMIAKENPFNARRVSRFGINVKDTNDNKS